MIDIGGLQQLLQHIDRGPREWPESEVLSEWLRKLHELRRASEYFDVSDKW